MTDITEQGPRGGALIYTESAYKSGQMKARGAIAAGQQYLKENGK